MLKTVLSHFHICSDIAVGAPFDGDGKVFIYRGSDAGIETKPAQVSFIQQLADERREGRKNQNE